MTLHKEILKNSVREGVRVVSQSTEGLKKFKFTKDKASGSGKEIGSQRICWAPSTHKYSVSDS